MSRQDPDSRVPPEAEATRPAAQDADRGESAPSANQTIGERVRSYLLRAAALLGVFVLLLALTTAGAGWYTSRTEFCRSCHIMEPYYRSWEASPSHRHVSCIKCHFPPGVGEKVRGKMLGLVQLAKYVTRSEGPRPAAEVSDASCLRSGCHETRLLAGRVDFHGIPFDHTPHLTKLRRGKKLRCVSCHSQVMVMRESHMSVTTSTCFLCHFKEGLFNEGLGACTRCHQIPDAQFELGGGAKFDHELAYTQGVDCENCHGDLIRGRGEVPHERCTVCHNRREDLERIDDHVFIHQKHVTDHKVDCLDCHLEIEHSLDPHKLQHAASDCQSCHPDHHREQISMLEGSGAKSISTHVSGMPMVRIECRSCHRFKQVSATGTVLWKASLEVCTSCHDASLADQLEAYHQTLRDSLAEMEACLQRARQALPADAPDERSAQLDNLQHDLEFLRVANGIHNVHYANTLTRGVLDQLKEVCRELGIPEPEVALPEPLEQLP